MRGFFGKSAIMLLLQAGLILSQQDGLPRGSISGVILRADSRDPISGAQVSLTAGTLPFKARPAVHQTVTVADGKFSFRNLAPGPYRIAATALGYSPSQFGQLTSIGQGRPLYVSADQTTGEVTILLSPAGSLSGRILDEERQPASGAIVQLLRTVYDSRGQRSFEAISKGSADDRGQYRMSNLPSGKYYLVAGSDPGTIRDRRYSEVYYPQSASMEGAVALDVRGGGETSIDMVVHRQVPNRTIRGRVVNLAEGALSNLALSLTLRNGARIPATSIDRITGDFEFRNLSPGEYFIQVQRPEDLNSELVRSVVAALRVAPREAANALGHWSEMPVHIDDSDIEDVVLTPKAGLSVKGKFVVEGVSSSFNLSGLRLVFDEQNAASVSPLGLPASTDGTFEVHGLHDKKYRVSLSGGALPSGFYIKSILYGGEDVLDKEFTPAGWGAAIFEVVLRQGVGEVRGQLLDAKNQPVQGVEVILIPGDRQRASRYRSSLTDSNGTFLLGSVAPGNYKIFSWEALDSKEYFDPAFLRGHEQKGLSVQVNENSVQQVNVYMVTSR